MRGPDADPRRALARGRDERTHGRRDLRRHRPGRPGRRLDRRARLRLPDRPGRPGSRHAVRDPGVPVPRADRSPRVASRPGIPGSGAGKRSRSGSNRSGAPRPARAERALARTSSRSAGETKFPEGRAHPRAPAGEPSSGPQRIDPDPGAPHLRARIRGWRRHLRRGRRGQPPLHHPVRPGRDLPPEPGRQARRRQARTRGVLRRDERRARRAAHRAGHLGRARGAARARRRDARIHVHRAAGDRDPLDPAAGRPLDRRRAQARRARPRRARRSADPLPRRRRPTSRTAKTSSISAPRCAISPPAPSSRSTRRTRRSTS